MTSPSDDEPLINQVRASTSEVRRSLRRGTGRAAIWLQKDPQNPDTNRELLRACLENLVYDPQCEATRAPYLCELIRISGQQDSYCTALEDRLRAATPNDSDGDIQQVFRILAEFGSQSGSGSTVLREFVLETGPIALAQAVAPDLIRLQGMSAFLACVRRFSRDEDWWLLREMMHALEEHDGTERAHSALRQACEADADLDSRIQLVDEKATPLHEHETIQSYDMLKAGASARRFPRSWILGASEHDLERAADDLLAETEDERILAFLALFRPRRFPGDPTSLFPLLGSANRRIAFSAASVLASINLPVIRTRAHQLIAEDHPDLGARLLRSSHGDGDIALLMTLLEQATDEDCYHSIGYSALHVIEHMDKKPQEATTVLLHLYGNGPCSNCRQRAVTQLAALNTVPDWMAAEGCFDAEPKIAQRFRAPFMVDK